MLLTDFKAVTEIDNKIDMLHKKLGDLYQLRAHYTTDIDGRTKKTNPATTAVWTEQLFQSLSQAWAQHSIEVPSFKSLKARLIKAQTVMRELESEEPGLDGKLCVLLVPPARLLDMHDHHGLRDRQDFIYSSDYLDPELKFGTSGTAWDVLVAYNAPEGLLLGSADAIVANKTYKLAGYDTRALGILEYKALSLQTPARLDDNCWTMLLKNYRPAIGEALASVACLNGQYRFEADDSAGLLGEEGFRPAVKVKA